MAVETEKFIVNGEQIESFGYSRPWQRRAGAVWKYIDKHPDVADIHIEPCRKPVDELGLVELVEEVQQYGFNYYDVLSDDNMGSIGWNTHGGKSYWASFGGHVGSGATAREALQRAWLKWQRAND